MAATRWKVEVTGLRQVLDALAEVDKRAARVVVKEITEAGKGVAAAAAGRVSGQPLSGWGQWVSGSRDLSYDVGSVRSGYKLRRNNFRRRGVTAGAGWDVYQTTPGGAIFELLGSGSTNFVQSIADRFPGRQPRTLLPAYYDVMTPERVEQIRDTITNEARKAGLV
jgi:hypothetical protein